MSSIIEEAMTYTKEKILRENRETVVRFWLNTKTRVSYFLDIYYEAGYDAWSFAIFNENHESTGEIMSEKWPCLQILLDQDVEEETFTSV